MPGRVLLRAAAASGRDGPGGSTQECRPLVRVEQWLASPRLTSRHRGPAPPRLVHLPFFTASETCHRGPPQSLAVTARPGPVGDVGPCGLVGVASRPSLPSSTNHTDPRT